MALGETLIDICEEADKPTRSTVYRWQEHIDGFSDTLARARELQAHYHAESIDRVNKMIESGEMKPDAGRVIAQNLMWRAKVLNPYVYAERKHVEQNVNVSGGLDHVLAQIGGSTKTALPGQAEELAVEHVAPQQALEVEYAVVSDDADKGK
jgi:hypothetical protein